MPEFLAQIIKILKQLETEPIVYGSFGVATYLGDFKTFGDLDLLINDEWINDRWEDLKKILESNGFTLIDKREHEFQFQDYKVGFASRNILIRDKIINDFSELVQYKNEDALTLSPESFLKAYKFSLQDGYRINTRNKKDQDIINRLKNFLED